MLTLVQQLIITGRKCTQSKFMPSSKINIGVENLFTIVGNKILHEVIVDLEFEDF